MEAQHFQKKKMAEAWWGKDQRRPSPWHMFTKESQVPFPSFPYKIPGSTYHGECGSIAHPMAKTSP